MANYVIYSDFDNTITQYDLLDRIITEVYSFETYKEAERQLLRGELAFEDYLIQFFDGIEYDLAQIPAAAVDPTFRAFYEWTQTQNIDFYVVSSGFKRAIRHLLPYVPEELIYANDFSLAADGKWKVELHAPGASVDKRAVVARHVKPGHKTIYVGDGLSDFKVMGQVDYLFCKEGSLLHEKCVAEGCPHLPFADFASVLRKIKNREEIL